MTDRSKFEQMLEHLINEDEQKAKELFHDIVVAKSREIYETLISEDFDEGMMPDEMPAEEPEMEASDEFSGDDATDDMMGDIEGGDEEGGDMGGDDVSLSGGDVDELQDRVVDLEDALDALRDEFESLMGGEEGGMTWAVMTWQTQVFQKWMVCHKKCQQWKFVMTMTKMVTTTQTKLSFVNT
jgi:hypothetical protein